MDEALELQIPHQVFLITALLEPHRDFLLPSLIPGQCFVQGLITDWIDFTDPEGFLNVLFS